MSLTINKGDPSPLSYPATSADDHFLEKFEEKSSSSTSAAVMPSFALGVDTIASAAPQVVPSSVPAEASAKPKLFSFETLVDIGKKVWSWFTSPFTSKEVSTSSEVASDVLAPATTASPMETPTLIRQKTAAHLSRQMQEQSYRIEEGSSEQKESFNRDERLLMTYYLIQQDLRREGVQNLQATLQLHQKKNQQLIHSLRRSGNESSDLESHISRCDQAQTIANIFLAVASVAGMIFAAVASGGAAVPAIITSATTIIQLSSGTMSGITMVVKGVLEKNQQEKQSEQELFRFEYKLTNEKLHEELKGTQHEHQQALENVALLKETLQNLQRTIKILSRK